MQLQKGISNILETKKRIYGYKIKHFGEPRVFTVSISNFCSDFKWHLFYDFDGELTDEQLGIITREFGFVIIKTKHGYQFINLQCQDLENVHITWQALQNAYPSDYFWSMPLFLRISEKVDENGKVISPAPDNPIPKDILLNHFLDRKLYRTFD